MRHLIRFVKLAKFLKLCLDQFHLYYLIGVQEKIEHKNLSAAMSIRCPWYFSLPCVNKFLGIRNEVQQIDDKMLPGVR